MDQINDKSVVITFVQKGKYCLMHKKQKQQILERINQLSYPVVIWSTPNLCFALVAFEILLLQSLLLEIYSPERN